MDRLEAMSLLVAVIDEGSLSAASRRLGVPLASVSRKIADLEKRLNSQLLIRSTRRLRPTDAGADYVAASRRILDLTREAEQAAAGEYVEPRGELVVSAPIAFGRLHVLPLICEFISAHAEIDVRLLLSDRNARLVDDHVDVAVRIGALPDSSLVATRVGSVRRIVCASPDLLSRRGTPSTPDDLAGVDVITFAGPDGLARWDFEGRSIRVLTRLHVDTAEAAVDAAIAGVGVTRVLSYQAAAAIRAGRLREALAPYAETLPVNLLHAAQGQLPLKSRRFIDVVAPALRRRLAD
jgi:DNA-binding transcriptional LysR family regulator